MDQAAADAIETKLLIVLVKRLGGSVTIPVSEVNATGSSLLTMEVDHAKGAFTFSVHSRS